MGKQIILLVEDTPTEMAKAKIAADNAGFKFVSGTTLEDAQRMMKALGNTISGIITDLHFCESSYEDPRNNPNAPCGLAVVVEAIERKIPVVICSDVDHHFAAYVTKIVRALEKSSAFGPIPFVMDSKNWEKAITELKPLLKGE